MAKRLACGGRGAAEVKEHDFFAPIDWDKLMAMELTPPFEPDFDVSKPTRQRIPKEQADRPQIDYFCHMVDCHTANPN